MQNCPYTNFENICHKNKLDYILIIGILKTK
jgi:hypothetical protein